MTNQTDQSRVKVLGATFLSHAPIFLRLVLGLGDFKLIWTKYESQLTLWGSVYSRYWEGVPTLASTKKDHIKAWVRLHDRNEPNPSQRCQSKSKDTWVLAQASQKMTAKRRIGLHEGEGCYWQSLRRCQPRLGSKGWPQQGEVVWVVDLEGGHLLAPKKHLKGDSKGI